MMPTAITTNFHITLPSRTLRLASGLHSGPSHTRQTHTHPLNTFYVFNLGVQKIRVDSRSTSLSWGRRWCVYVYGREGGCGGGALRSVSIRFVRERQVQCNHNQLNTVDPGSQLPASFHISHPLLLPGDRMFDWILSFCIIFDCLNQQWFHGFTVQDVSI